MMTLKLQIVIGLAILVVLGILINMIRRRSLELKYAMSWMRLCAEASDRGIGFSWNLCTGEHDILFGILFFAADYIFADRGSVTAVQQCEDTGSDCGPE